MEGAFSRSRRISLDVRAARVASRHINQRQQFAVACQNVNLNTFISRQMDTRVHTLSE